MTVKHPPLNIVYFAHGKESGPWGTKIQHLARIARMKGFAVESVDFQGMEDPQARVDRLLSRKPSAIGNLVLAGSSMGGYVVAAASEILQPNGLFLMAPAVLLEGFGRQDLAPKADVACAVHGWHDDIVPPENAIGFCRRHTIPLHLLDCGHTLKRALPEVIRQFEGFLDAVAAPK